MNKNTMVRVAVLWNDSVFSETLISPTKGATLGTHKKADGPGGVAAKESLHREYVQST